MRVYVQEELLDKVRLIFPEEDLPPRPFDPLGTFFERVY